MTLRRSGGSEERSRGTFDPILERARRKPSFLQRELFERETRRMESSGSQAGQRVAATARLRLLRRRGGGRRTEEDLGVRE